MSSIGDTVYLFGGLTGTEASTAVNCLHAFEAAGAQGWQELGDCTDPAAPMPRYGHGMEAVAATATNTVEGFSKLVVFGGINKNGTVLNDLFIYDVDKDTWTDEGAEATGTPPAARYLHGMAKTGDLIWVLGGRLSGENEAPLASDLVYYDVAARQWQLVNAEGAPSARFGHGMAGLGTFVYVFGGASGPLSDTTVMNDLYRYSYTGDWENLGAMVQGEPPSPRLLGGMAASGNALYIFGGLARYGDAESLRDLHILDIEEQRWVAFQPSCTAIPDPFPTSYFAGQDVAVLGHKIMVYGDAADQSEGHLFSAELQTLGVEVLPDEEGPPARTNHGMAAIADTVYVFAGSLDLLGATSYNDLHAFEVPARRWRNLNTNAAGERPGKRFLHGMAAVGEELWVFGGGAYVTGFVCEPTPAALNDLHSYHTTTRVWTNHNSTDGVTPIQRWGHGMVSVDRSLFVFGGYSQTQGGNATHPECVRMYLNGLHAFDTQTRTWTDLSQPISGTPPPARAMGGMAESSGMLYIFGGLTHFGNVHLNDLHAYQIDNARWTDLSTPDFGYPPEPRAWFPMGIASGTLSHSMRTSGEVLYVIGGYRRVPNEDAFLFYDVHAYDISTRSWAEIEFPCDNFPSPPSRLYQHMAILGNIFYMFGGVQDRDGNEEGPLFHAIKVCPSAYCNIFLPSNTAATTRPSDSTAAATTRPSDSTPPPDAEEFVAVLFQARLGYSAADFASREASYIGGVARAAQVEERAVEILSIREEEVRRRRLLAASVLVDTRVTLQFADSAAGVQDRLRSQVKAEMEELELEYLGLTVQPQVVDDQDTRVSDLPTTTPTPAEDDGGGGLSGGAIAGIAVAVLAGLGLVGVVVYALSRRQSKLEDLHDANGHELHRVESAAPVPPALEMENSTAQPAKV